MIQIKSYEVSVNVGGSRSDWTNENWSFRVAFHDFLLNFELRKALLQWGEKLVMDGWLSG